MLLTPIIKNLVNIGFLWGQTLYCLPYDWNELKGQPELTRSPLRFAGWLYSMGATVGAAILLAYRWVSVLMEYDTVSYLETFLMRTTLLTFLPLVGLKFMVLIHRKSLPKLYIKLMGLCSSFNGQYESLERRKQELHKFDSWGQSARFNYYFGFFNFITVPVLMLQPDNFLNIFPVKGSPSSVLDCLKIFVSAVFMGQMISSIMTDIYLWTYVGSLLLMVTVKILEQLGDMPGNYWTREGLRYPRQFVRTYQWLGIIHAHYRIILTQLALAVQIFAVLNIILHAHMAIRVKDNLVMTAMWSAPMVINLIFYTVCIGTSAKVHEDSGNVLESWKNCPDYKMLGRKMSSVNKEKMWLKMCLKSFRPLCIQMSPFFVVDRKLAMNGVSFIVDETIALLLATKEEE